MVISLDLPPTPDDLSEVGRCLAMRPSAAAPDLGRLVGWAECLGVAGAAAEVLLDPTAPDVVRARALAVVSSQVLAELALGNGSDDGTDELRRCGPLEIAQIGLDRPRVPSPAVRRFS